LRAVCVPHDICFDVGEATPLFSYRSLLCGNEWLAALVDSQLCADTRGASTLTVTALPEPVGSTTITMRVHVCIWGGVCDGVCVRVCSCVCVSVCVCVFLSEG